MRDRFDSADGDSSSSRVRLQRYLADAGVAARRACEEMIEEGRVEVNGSIVTKLPVFIDPQVDKVRVDGRTVAKPQAAVTILVHKPQRVLVTASDEPGMDRATILDFVKHSAAPRLFPVGRLGWDDAGLVVLTNDGEIANALTHPSFQVPKRYEVLVAGAVGNAELAKIKRQAKLIAKASAFEDRKEKRSEQRREFGEGPQRVRSAAGGEMHVVVLDQEASGQGEMMTAGKTVLGITMGDAKGKPLRDILHGAGLPVRKLTRVAIGPLTLRGLKVGSWREVSREELRVLRAIVDDGKYDEQRAMRLMERGEKSLRAANAAAANNRANPAPFWPAPVLRQEAMKQQRVAQKKNRQRPTRISDQLLEERGERPSSPSKTRASELQPRERSQRGGERGLERDSARPAKPQGRPSTQQAKPAKPGFRPRGERVQPKATPRGKVPPAAHGQKRESPMDDSALIRRRKPGASDEN
jgi:23S rRNA pseudouridine2605 synthase